MSGKENCDYTVGSYLAKRLKQCGVSHVFTVPGDFSMNLLDEIKRDGEIQLVTCCNELNAAYAADGYSRECKTIGVVVVTYMVGSLSALSAVAGAFAEDVPLLVICGSPNNKELLDHNIVHHTLATREIDTSIRCYEALKVPTYAIRSMNLATANIDDAIHRCIDSSKPVYLEIACNLANRCVPEPTPLDSFRSTLMFESEELSLQNATQDVIDKIKSSQKIVVVAGSKILKVYDGKNLFSTFTHALGAAVVAMPDAKGVFSEEDELFAGCYWGPVSWPLVEDMVASADMTIFIGPVFNDYTTAAWNLKIKPEKKVVIATDHVHVYGKRYPFVYMPDILTRLSESVPQKPQTLQDFKERVAKEGDKLKPEEFTDEQPLNGTVLQQVIQQNVLHYSSIVADSGDSWFIGSKLNMTEGTDYHVQLQYGSIGWSVGTVVGVGLGNKNSGGGRTLALIGDGAFQASAQELSTWIKEGLDVTIILLNNGCYAIENQIHKEQYNTIVNWKYAEFPTMLNDLKTDIFTSCVKTVGELNNAFDSISDRPGLAFIECQIDFSDCTSEMKQWSRLVADYNNR